MPSWVSDCCSIVWCSHKHLLGTTSTTGTVPRSCLVQGCWIWYIDIPIWGPTKQICGRQYSKIRTYAETWYNIMNTLFDGYLVRNESAQCICVMKFDTTKFETQNYTMLVRPKNAYIVNSGLNIFFCKKLNMQASCSWLVGTAQSGWLEAWTTQTVLFKKNSMLILQKYQHDIKTCYTLIRDLVYKNQAQTLFMRTIAGCSMICLFILTPGRPWAVRTCEWMFHSQCSTWHWT